MEANSQELKNSQEPKDNQSPSSYLECLPNEILCFIEDAHKSSCRKELVKNSIIIKIEPYPELEGDMFDAFVATDDELTSDNYPHCIKAKNYKDHKYKIQPYQRDTLAISQLKKMFMIFGFDPGSDSGDKLAKIIYKRLGLIGKKFIYLYFMREDIPKDYPEYNDKSCFEYETELREKVENFVSKLTFTMLEDVINIRIHTNYIDLIEFDKE